MKRPVLVTALFGLLVAASPAQTPRAYEEAARSAFAGKDYYAAMKYYEKVLEIQPERWELCFRYAEAAQLFGAFRAAEQQYERILEGGHSKDFPLAALQLATVKKTLGKYDQAIRHYQTFLAQGNIDATNARQAEAEINACEWALEQVNQPDVTVRIERMPEMVNTDLSEFAARPFGDTLLFTAFRQTSWADKRKPTRPLIRLMQSVDNQEPVPFARFNAPNRHTAHLTISADGRLAVFNYCDYTGDTEIRCDLYFSRALEDGSWTAPEPLPEPVNNTAYTSTQPHLSPDGGSGNYTLYFVSDRPGGKGGFDLWFSRIDLSGNATPPRNLSALNTTGDEVTPFFDDKNGMLYFSTTGLPTLGGFDIYKVPLENNRWGTPEHLGIPINSSYNDMYFLPLEDGRAYFSSNRIAPGAPETDACCYDLYQSTMLPIRLETSAFTDDGGSVLSGVQFTLTPLSDPTAAIVLEAGDQAVWELQRRQSYCIVAHKEGYLPDTSYVDTERLPADRRFVKKLRLKPDIRLSVRVLHQLSETPLDDVAIRLQTLNGHAAGSARSAGGQVPDMRVDAGRHYRIIAEKDGFHPDTLLVDETALREIAPGGRLERNIFLTPANLSGYLPLTLYFDNDQPSLKSGIQPYNQSVQTYLERREEFIRQFTTGMTDAESEQAAARLHQFFEEEVRAGFVKLEYFAENLDLFLDHNYSVVILVRGFASPLANDAYNLALTKRRIASVIRYFRQYGNGRYAAALQSDQLQVQTAPLGETSAAKGTSDDRNNRRLSVYSVEASLERRAEIIEVKLTKN